MIDYSELLQFIRHSELSPWAEQLPQHIAEGLSTKRFGDLPAWYDALNTMPNIQTNKLEFKNAVRIGDKADITEHTLNQLESSLRKLIPWRKGPYNIYDIHLNTEWRSDWKWERVLPHISPLKNKLVLDVGCGNGYHCWRMYGEGAARVIGIDPSPRFVVQFYMLKKLTGILPVDVLPVGIEAVPAKLQAFDTCFSMGVLYHRRSPFDHLRELWDTLKPGGELVLETLVIKGELGESLVPEGRYAKMNNVWFLPSVPTLISWLNKSGYQNAKCVDVSTTTIEEQRATNWMLFQSLPDFLDPDNKHLTVEGHPAPIRATIVARKPE